MSLLAAIAAAVAALLWCPPGQLIWRLRLGRLPTGGFRTRLTILVVLGALLSRLAGGFGPRWIVAATALGVGTFAVGQRRASRRREQIRQRRSEVCDLLALLAAELRAGQLPGRAIAGLSGEFDFLVGAARAGTAGADVPASLNDAACTPGREKLREVAACWQVADRAGAPLAVVLGRLEQASRDDQEIARDVQSNAAPARATGRLMAVLPVVGLALGSGLGGNPLTVLVDSWIGAICLLTGSTLACAGVAWIERIASRSEEQP